MSESKWCKRMIGEIASVKGGKRLPAGFSLQSLPSRRPYIRVADMYQGGVELTDIRYVPEEAISYIENYRIFDNEVFISVAGTLGIVGRIPASLNGANLTENANKITNIQCDIDYLMYALQSKSVQDEIESIRTVGAQPKLALGRIRTFEIDLPLDQKEQARISNAIRGADDLIFALERLIEKKQAVKQGMMQQLLTGRTRLPGFEEEWTPKRLGELGRCIRGVGYDPGMDLSSGDRPFTVRLLRSNNVQEGRIIRQNLQFVHERKVTAQQLLMSGDVVICMANGSRDLVGKAALFNTGLDAHRYTIGAFMGAFRSNNVATDPQFVAAMMYTHLFRKWLDVVLSGSSINNLRSSDIEGFTTDMPEADERYVIGKVLHEADEEIAILRTRLEKAHDVKLGMMQQLLTGRIRLPADVTV